MEWFDMLLVGGILLFLGLVIWAQIERKSIKDILMEIRDIIKELGK